MENHMEYQVYIGIIRPLLSPGNEPSSCMFGNMVSLIGLRGVVVIHKPCIPPWSRYRACVALPTPSIQHKPTGTPFGLLSKLWPLMVKDHISAPNI